MYTEHVHDRLCEIHPNMLFSLCVGAYMCLNRNDVIVFWGTMSIFGVLNTDSEVQTELCSSITLQGLEEQTCLSAHRGPSKGRSLKTALIKLQMYSADSMDIIH